MPHETFLDTLPSPLSRQARQLFTAWQRWRNGHRLPQWRDVRLGDLGELAETCLLLNIRGSDEIRIDHVGTKITAMLGFSLAGMNYLDLTSKANRAWRSHLTIAQAAQPCGVVIYYMLRFPDGGILPVEFTGAPLLEPDTRDANLILCCATGLSEALMRHADQPVDPDSYEEGDGMRFIDIGFGIPPLDPSQRQAARPVQ